MNKQEIYDYLNSRDIWHEITEHEAVYNMEEVAQIQLPYPEQEAKNLFVRDDKKKNYYLITVKGEKRVDLKEFRSRNNTCLLYTSHYNGTAVIHAVGYFVVAVVGMLIGTIIFKVFHRKS